jgi:serine/threonine protein kinase/cytochrome c-type biogenesis protein CcmH/NrfG
MNLVELALSRPEDEREGYLRSACGSNTELFAEAWSYIHWEKRMQGFLLDPLHPPACGQAPFEPGQLLINRFRLVREVAQGGMGIVWEALDQKLDRRVALKCAKAGFGKQLPPEVRNAREISHPNVCKIFEIHTASTVDGEIDFISMEFLEGETLSERIRRAPLAEREARIVAQQLCSGLAEAHRNHLVHGDLKTNNVILTTDSEGSVRAVITDFGLARQVGASTTVLGGTPAYMAPELWKGEKPSVLSDIYALGVMLWELHSGRAPSDLGVLSSTLPIGERVSWKPPAGRGRWDRIIARCLHPDPARRFQCATEIVEAFGPSRLLKRLLAVAAILVVAVGSGVFTYQRATAPKETVRLALLPVGSALETGSVSETLFRKTAEQLAEVKGTSHTRLKFVPLDNVIRNRVNTGDEARVLLGASHALRATVDRHGEGFTVRAYLTDVRSGVDARQWTGEYKPGEMRYAPTALAGLVTGTLHLPPVADGATVNAAARKDYASGRAAVRRDSSVDEGLRLLQRAVAADPDSAVTWAGLAEAQWFKYASTTDKIWLDRTAESVEQAENRNPDLPEVHRIAGLLQDDAGWYQQAIASYVRAIEIDPGNADAYRRLGETYNHNEQTDEALSAFHKAIERDPQQYRNYRDLGDCYVERARYQEAITQFRKALELAPNEPLVRYHLGRAYLDAGQLAAAEREMRMAIALKEIPNGLGSLGLVLIYQSRDSEAIPVILRALQLSPKECVWWMDLGIAYARVGDASDSVRAFQHASDLAEQELTQNPRFTLSRAYLAYSSARLGDHRRSDSEIAQALQQSPSDADVRFMAAITYEALGRREDTLAVLSTAPPGVLADVDRWPDVAELHNDSRFLRLLAPHGR